MDDHLQALNIEEQWMVVEPIEGLEEILLNNSKLEWTTKIGTLTSSPVRQALTTFLRKNQDVFSLSHKDMPGIDLSAMVHKLNISPSFPFIYQRKRVFAQEGDKAIVEEVRKLQDVEFIREVYYPDWLANAVMVKKTSEKWRMYVDFTDLNKAYPKDSY